MSCGGRGGVQEHPRRLTEREYGSSTCSLLLDIVPSALTEPAHPLLRAATAPTPAPLDHAPLPSDVTRFFWDAVQQGRLMFLRCQACRHFMHYPRTLCNRCLSEDLAPEAVSGRATVATYKK